MKKLLFSIAIGLFLSLSLFSCIDDNVIGSSLLPSQDTVTVLFNTIPVQTKTIRKDSVYLRNSTAVLGEFTDPIYGTLKSDFMSQLYCPFDFEFPNDVRRIDSAYVYFNYSGYFGDSSTVHHVNVWYLDKAPLSTSASYGTFTDPSLYCGKDSLLASGTFTTGDFINSDSVKALSSYSKVLKLPLNMAFCEKMLADNRKNKADFRSPSAFNQYFNGIYVTTDYGNGSLLYITHAELEMIYKTYRYSHSSGMEQRDSLVMNAAYFPINKEVRQVNRAKHPDLDKYLDVTAPDSLNYVYAPAGLFTQVTIPTSIFQKGTGQLSGKKVNGMKLYVNATQVETDKDYALNPPSTLLLIDASKANAFFNGFELNDGLYSFVANYNSDSLNYVFDLSYYAQKMIRANDQTNNIDFTPFTEMLLIPVNTVQNGNSENVRQEHLITPAAVKICGSSHPTRPMQLKVVYTKPN